MSCTSWGQSVESAPQNSIEISDVWSPVVEKDGIEVSYKVQECETEELRAQVLVLFRIENTSDTEIKTFNWSVKEYRNGACTNCNALESQEFQRSVTLSPGEILEGDGASKSDKRVYLFGQFINLVPGMSNQKLTDFEFVQMEVINQGTQK